MVRVTPSDVAVTVKALPGTESPVTTSLWSMIRYFPSATYALANIGAVFGVSTLTGRRSKLPTSPLPSSALRSGLVAGASYVSHASPWEGIGRARVSVTVEPETDTSEAANVQNPLHAGIPGAPP